MSSAHSKPNSFSWRLKESLRSITSGKSKTRRTRNKSRSVSPKPPAPPLSRKASLRRKKGGSEQKPSSFRTYSSLADEDLAGGEGVDLVFPEQGGTLPGFNSSFRSNNGADAAPRSMKKKKTPNTKSTKKPKSKKKVGRRSKTVPPMRRKRRSVASTSQERRNHHMHLQCQRRRRLMEDKFITKSLGIDNLGMCTRHPDQFITILSYQLTQIHTCSTCTKEHKSGVLSGKQRFRTILTPVRLFNPTTRKSLPPRSKSMGSSTPTRNSSIASTEDVLKSSTDTDSHHSHGRNKQGWNEIDQNRKALLSLVEWEAQLDARVTQVHEWKNKQSLQEHPVYHEFFRMLKLGMPLRVVQNACEVDGYDVRPLDLDPTLSLKAQIHTMPSEMVVDLEEYVHMEENESNDLMSAEAIFAKTREAFNAHRSSLIFEAENALDAMERSMVKKKKKKKKTPKKKRSSSPADDEKPKSLGDLTLELEEVQDLMTRKTPKAAKSTGDLFSSKKKGKSSIKSKASLDSEDSSSLGLTTEDKLQEQLGLAIHKLYEKEIELSAIKANATQKDSIIEGLKRRLDLLELAAGGEPAGVAAPEVERKLSHMSMGSVMTAVQTNRTVDQIIMEEMPDDDDETDALERSVVIPKGNHSPGSGRMSEDNSIADSTYNMRLRTSLPSSRNNSNASSNGTPDHYKGDATTGDSWRPLQFDATAPPKQLLKVPAPRGPRKIRIQKPEKPTVEFSKELLDRETSNDLGGSQSQSFSSNYSESTYNGNDYYEEATQYTQATYRTTGSMEPSVVVPLGMAIVRNTFNPMDRETPPPSSEFDDCFTKPKQPSLEGTEETKGSSESDDEDRRDGEDEEGAIEYTTAIKDGAPNEAASPQTPPSSPIKTSASQDDVPYVGEVSPSDTKESVTRKTSFKEDLDNKTTLEGQPVTILA